MARRHPGWGWKLGGILAAVALVVGLAACGGGGSSTGGGTGEAAGGGGGGGEEASSGGSYFVGSTQDLTGPVAFIGGPVSAGFETCAAVVNEEGGVNGKQLEFEALDDQSSSEKALTNMKTLLSKDPVAFISNVTSDAEVPVDEKLAEEEIPSIAYATAEELNENTYYYSVGISTLESFNVAGNYIASKVGGKKPTVAVVGIETPAGISGAKEFGEALEGLGWKVKVTDPVSLTAPDASTQTQEVASSGAEFVVTGLLGNQVPVLAKALKQEGVDAPVINFAPVSEDGVLKAANSEDFEVVRDWAAPSDPESKTAAEVREAAQKAGKDDAENMGSPNFSKGWGECKIVVKALETCGAECDGAGLKEALDEINEFEIGDLTEPITFTEESRQGVDSGRVYEWDPSAGNAKAISEYFTGTELEAG
jgi:branched-chain amino acid transport system substrate-binding protein